MNEIALVSIFIGVLVIAARGPLIFAPAVYTCRFIESVAGW